MAEVGPQRLQDVEAELLEVADRREGRRVVYALRDGDEVQVGDVVMRVSRR